MVACAAALSLCLCLPHQCGNKYPFPKAPPRIPVIKNVEVFEPSVVVAAGGVVAALAMIPPLYKNAESNAILADNDRIRTQAEYPEADLLTAAMV